MESYDPATHEAPLVIGHSGDNDSTPSYGWIKKFVRKGDDLYADVNFTDVAKDLVKDGHYRKVSISFYSPDSPINPHKGKWSARHLALLGAAPPAVKGLEPLSFSEKKGVFDFAIALSPEDIFDKELGPTMILERSPLEMLRDRLQEVRGDIDASLEQLKENQEAQTESDIGDSETTNQADNSAPENPNEEFSEMKMKKKMGREGAEASESAQKLADLETEFPEGDEEFDEGVSRVKAKGAHGQEVQVVEEVYEEGELPPALKANAEKMKAKAKAKHSMDHEEEMEGDEDEYAEVGYKVTEPGNKVSFRKRAEKNPSDPAGRGTTARSRQDSYAGRQTVGKGAEEDREGVTADSHQDEDRVKTAKSDLQDKSRVKLAKSASEESDEEARWADQPEGKKRSRNADQFDDEHEAGVSDGNDPHGRDGGPTEVSSLSEEEPDGEEIAVPLESTKGNKVARVLHTSSGQKRAALKGGAIADHSEESDGVTRTAKKAGVSDGTDPHGRDGGPTEFPTRSEEDPDDLEMAVDLEDATQSDKVRIIRQKSGDKPSVDHSEDDVRDPMTKTGKGSTYGKKAEEMEDDYEDEEEDEEDFNEFLDKLLYSDLDEDEEDEEEDFAEADTEDFCGMGSMGQAKAMGFPQQMYEELMNLKAENDRLKREYEESKIRSRKEKIAQFVDSLYTEGKLTDGIMPQREFQHYCEGLELGTLEFAEGETPTSKLFELLNRLPNMVYFGEVVADGIYQTPEEQEEELDPHNRALRMVANGEASDYVEAIKRCINWGN